MRGIEGKSSTSAEPSMKKQDKKSNDDVENDAENDEQQQLQKEEEPAIEINWDEDIIYTWNCDEIRRKIKTCLFPSFPGLVFLNKWLTFPVPTQFSKIAVWRPLPSNAPSTHPRAHSYVS